MDIKKAKLDGRMYSVIDGDQLYESPELYRNHMTAVEVQDDEGNKYILPYRPGNQALDKVGVYKMDGLGDLYVYPSTDDEKAQYMNPRIYDMGNVTNIKEYSRISRQVRDLENEILTNVDNVFIPPISGKESPEMKALKDAVTAKGIDLDLYSDRFGDNYPNDKRQLRGDSITLFMLKRFADKLDMRVTLTISDAPDAPNPIGHDITTELTGRGDTDK